jgi:hypothetical protein
MVRRLLFGFIFTFIGVYALWLYFNPPYYTNIVIEDPVAEMEQLYQNEDFQTLKLYSDFVLSLPFDEETKAKAQEYKTKATEILDSPLYKIKKCAKGFITGSVEDISSLVCVSVSDFFVLGDVRDLAIQGWKYMKGDEVDELIVLLSTAGIISSLGPQFDLPLSVIKSFAKLKAISKALAERLISLIKGGDTEKLKHVMENTNLVVNAYKDYGFVPLARAYKYVDNEVELANYATLTDKLGPASSYVLITKTEGKILKKMGDNNKGVVVSILSPKLNGFNTIKVIGKDVVVRGGWKIALEELLGLLKGALGVFFPVVMAVITFLGLWLVLGTKYLKALLKVVLGLIVLLFLITIIFAVIVYFSKQ